MTPGGIRHGCQPVVTCGAELPGDSVENHLIEQQREAHRLTGEQQVLAPPRLLGCLLGRTADYRGATVTFHCELRAEDVAGHAELFLFVVTPDRRQGLDAIGPAITDSGDWERHQVTAQVPGDAELIRFGLTLTGPGQVSLRDVRLTRSS